MFSRTTGALTLVALMLAGCQQPRTSYLAPSFAPPVIQPPRGPLPASTPPDRHIQTAPAIAAVKPDQIIDGTALKPRVPARQWKYIVIHHSATEVSSAKRIHTAHRARGWDSLGYNFVIGNGSETANGLIEIGPRWTYQRDGAHAGVVEYNQHGIGICLVGNFDASHPTAAQMDSLARLSAYLMKTYKIPATHIIGHKDCGRATACPGKHMDLARVRALATRYAQQLQ